MRLNVLDRPGNTCVLIAAILLASGLQSTRASTSALAVPNEVTESRVEQPVNDATDGKRARGTKADFGFVEVRQGAHMFW